MTQRASRVAPNSTGTALLSSGKRSFPSAGQAGRVTWVIIASNEVDHPALPRSENGRGPPHRGSLGRFIALA
jgi:hypothetical protein